MKLRNSILFLILVCCLCFVVTGCSVLFPVKPAEPVQYNITIDEKIENGSIQCDVTSAKAGETIAVTATADENYQLVSITVNGEAITGNSFVMPEKDVVLGATFDLAASVTEAIPEGALVINSQSAGGSAATGHITLTFGESGLNFEAFVEDSSVVEKDGVAILFSREVPKIAGLLADGQTIKVSVSAKGVVSLLATDANGALQAAELAGVTTSYGSWSKDGERLDGYHVEIFVPYEVLGTTAENAKGNITVCPVVYSAYGSLPAQATSLNGAVEDAQNTFVVLMDDNTIRDNKYNMTSAQLGSCGSLDAGYYWDLSKDYYEDDTENYPNREVLLTGHDGNDNNLVFYRVSNNEMYVRATITATGVTNKNDQWPKFGLMLFDGANKKGVYYYVDAIMSGNSGNTLDNIVGRAVGYNIANGVDYSNSWNTVKESVFNLETMTIVMEMVYQNGWVHMYADGQLVQSVYYGSYNENLHFGFKSFGIDLKITDYLASDDAEADGWADKKVAPPDARKVDILFAGDSYMQLWKERHMGNQMSYTGASYENLGVGGTKVQYWVDKLPELVEQYNPQKIAFHIGVNDIDDANAAPEVVLEDLKNLFDLYHEKFPNATIYWNSLIPNTMFASKYEDYKVINAGVVDYASERDWLVYIDQTTVFELNGAARNDVLDDGLHLSVDIGYPIWANVMLTAMGYERPDGTTMGDIDRYSHTGLWQFGTDENGEYAFSAGNWDTSLWFKDVSGENVYVEAIFSATKLNNGDGYPKFGILVRNDKESRWGFIDAVAFNQANTSAGLVYRGVSGIAQYQWDWNSAVWGGATGCDFGNVKLAIAKVDNTVYFLVNGAVYASAPFEGEVVVGMESFNLEIKISDVKTSTDADYIRSQLRYRHNITVKGENGAVSVDVPKNALNGETVTATINVAEGQTLDYVKVNGEPCEVVEGKITFEMPNGAVEIEVALKGLEVKSHVSEKDGNTGINASIKTESVIAAIGETITFTVEYDANEMTLLSVTVNGEEITPVEGVYSYTVKTSDTAVDIAATTEYILSEQIDGVKSDSYGTPVTMKVEGGRYLNVWAKTDAYGVYFYFEAVSATLSTDKDFFWDNNNFEFRLNGAEHGGVNTKGEIYRASRGYYKYEQLDDGKYHHVAEAYVNRCLIPGFNAESVNLAYAFKTPGETVWHENMVNNQWNRTDWWRSGHGTPHGGEPIGLGKPYGIPECIHITANGLVHDCERASIDGDLSEYPVNNDFIGMGNDNAKFDFVGYVANDGVYIGITIYQTKLGETTGEWWDTDNLEIKLLGDRAGFTIVEDFIAGCAPISDYALARHYDEALGKWVTTIELFYAYEFNGAKQATFQVGVNGNGFQGWQSLMWDGNVPYITENGIEWVTLFLDWWGAQKVVAEKFAAGEGIVIDGVANEALYNGLTSVTYENINGAKIVVTGRKYSTGILACTTITHTRPATDVIQGAGDAWWNFLDVEYRMAGNYSTQMATSVFEDGNWDAYCASKAVTTDNGDGTYTTVFETFLPFTTEYGGMNYSGDVQVCIGGVFETGFQWVTGLENSALHANEKGFFVK